MISHFTPSNPDLVDFVLEVVQVGAAFVGMAAAAFAVLGFCGVPSQQIMSLLGLH